MLNAVKCKGEVSAMQDRYNKGNRFLNKCRKGNMYRSFVLRLGYKQACAPCSSKILCHVGNAVLLVLFLFEHGVFEPLCGFGAVRVDICGPEMRNGVFDDEECGNRERPDEPVG